MSDTRQTDCVPSTANKTLGKHMTLGKVSLCRVLFPRHSAKPPFAEWHKPSTRQTIADTECHCCCTRQTVQALPSACRHGTRQSRVTVSWPFLLFFLPRALSADKKHSANSALLSIWLPCDVCRGWHSAKPLPSAFRPLPKQGKSGSESLRVYTHPCESTHKYSTGH